MSSASFIPEPRDAAPARSGYDWEEAGRHAAGDELRALPAWELALLLSEALVVLGPREAYAKRAVGSQAREALTSLGEAVEAVERLHYYLGAALGTEGAVVGAEPA